MIRKYRTQNLTLNALQGLLNPANISLEDCKVEWRAGEQIPDEITDYCYVAQEVPDSMLVYPNSPYPLYQVYQIPLLSTADRTKDFIRTVEGNILRPSTYYILNQVAGDEILRRNSVTKLYRDIISFSAQINNKALKDEEIYTLYYYLHQVLGYKTIKGDDQEETKPLTIQSKKR